MSTIRILLVAVALACLINPSASFAESDEASMYAQARTHFQESNYYFASTWLERILNRFPKTPQREEVLMMLAKSYAATSRDEKAVRTLKTLLKDFPKSAGKIEPGLLKMVQDPAQPPQLAEPVQSAPESVPAAKAAPVTAVVAPSAAAAEVAEKAAAVKAAEEKAVADKAAAEKAVADKAAQEKAAAEKAVADKAAEEKAAAEKAVADKAAEEKAAAEKAAADKAAADKLIADRVAADRVAAQRVEAEKAAAEKEAAEKAAAKKATLGKAMTVEEATAERAAAIKAAVEKAAERKAEAQAEPVKAAAVPEPAAQPAPAPAEAAAPATAPAQTAPVTIPEPPAVVPAPPEQAVNAPAGASVAESLYTLDFGSYVLKSEMVPIKKKIKSAGLKPVVEPGPKKKEQMSRIHVGEYPDQKSAEKMLQKLRKAKAEQFVLKDKSGVFNVYAGSYFDKLGAVDEQLRLAGFGITTELRQISVQVPTFTLTAGSFKSEDEAARKGAELERLGVKPAVVRRAVTK